jgi:phospholipase/lecithinase/hemolysin
VGQYTGATVHNYAVAGAVCANSLTPRTREPTQQLFPDIATYEIPAFLADDNYVLSNGTKFMTIPTESTVFAIMIGGNDVGAYGYLTDSQVAGTTIPNYVDCVFEQIDRLYQHGARHFILNTLGALYLSPQYGMPGAGGLRATQYWLDKYSNITASSQRMLEQVALVNAIYKARTPLDVECRRRYPEAQFALVDLEALVGSSNGSREPWNVLVLTLFYQMNDIYHHPKEYLNGTAPLNVTGYINHCALNGTDCARTDNNNPDAFMWYDELHPSEQTWRMIAKSFVQVIKGHGKWTRYYSG